MDGGLLQTIVLMLLGLGITSGVLLIFVLPIRWLVASRSKQDIHSQIMVVSWGAYNWFGKVLFVLFTVPALAIVFVISMYAKGADDIRQDNMHRLIHTYSHTQTKAKD
jgi:hypothetical protein